jgi:hypothetical protein
MTPLERFKKERTKEAQRRAREAHHAAHTRYKITYQWRRPEGPRPGMPLGPGHWEAWRCFGSIPILFHTLKEAETYMKEFPIFKNMGHLRKVSASIAQVKI